jgi:EAL and modified HD-GYP domain-containing signal transduction protein
MSRVYIARQPILDRQRRVAGYELLFRSAGDVSRAAVSNAEEATSSVVLNTLTEFSLDYVVGQQRAWINVTRRFVLDGLAETLPPKRVTLEVLENQEVDSLLVSTLARLRERGFTIALDDFTYDDGTAPLLEVADIVKVDVMALGVDGAAAQLRRLREHDLLVVAEKVETHEEFAALDALGFDLYQGYFFCKPETLQTKAIGANRVALLQLLAALNDPDIALARLEELIAHDVALSYRLLRYINSAFFSLRTRIDGIGRAVALLGLINVKRWATMTIFAGIEGKPRELLTTALCRARMCELLAPSVGKSPDRMFTIGLFSVVDALLDSPMHDVLTAVPFPHEMYLALTAHRGPKGELLAAVLAWERGEFDRVPASVRRDHLAEVQAEAFRWADEAASELLEPDAGKLAA